MLNTHTLCCKAVCLMRAGVKWKCEIHYGQMVWQTLVHPTMQAMLAVMLVSFM